MSSESFPRDNDPHDPATRNLPWHQLDDILAGAVASDLEAAADDEAGRQEDLELIRIENRVMSILEACGVDLSALREAKAVMPGETMGNFALALLDTPNQAEDATSIADTALIIQKIAHVIGIADSPDAATAADPNDPKAAQRQRDWYRQELELSLFTEELIADKPWELAKWLNAIGALLPNAKGYDFSSPQAPGTIRRYQLEHREELATGALISKRQELALAALQEFRAKQFMGEHDDLDQFFVTLAYFLSRIHALDQESAAPFRVLMEKESLPARAEAMGWTPQQYEQAVDAVLQAFESPTD